MIRFIPAFPTLSLAQLTAPAKTYDFASLFPSRNIVYYFRGASAVYHAVKSLGLSSTDEVLVPSFHCGIEIEALIQAGVKIRYYKITADLNADLDDIPQKITSNTKALFVIHYYGFPQPLEMIRKICAEKKLLLIEDCAHALFSRSVDGNYLGKTANAAIFSFQKTLPVPDGGALVCDRPHPSPVLTPGFLSTYRSLSLLRLTHMRRCCTGFYILLLKIILEPARWLWRALKKLSGRQQNIQAPNSMEFSKDVADTAISKTAASLISKSDEKKIVARRRENFNRLFQELKNVKSAQPVFEHLPEHVCPLFFPIRVADREKTKAFFAARGVETFIFGEFLHSSLPVGEYPEAQKASREILCLPIHQDMTPGDVEYVGQILCTTSPTPGVRKVG